MCERSWRFFQNFVYGNVGYAPEKVYRATLSCLFPLDVQNEIQLLSRLFCNSWLVCLLCFLLTDAQLVALEIRFRMASFSKMRLLTCICLRHKRVEKSRAILGHLMTFRSCILADKREQLLSLMCFFFQFPEVERMVYAA